MKTKRSCEELFKEYQKNRNIISARRIQFYLGEDDDRDVYNISAPLQWKGETLIAGRVEARDSEVSETVFFEEKDGIWRKKEGYPVLRLQDPFITKLDDEIMVGGVEIYDDPECGGRLAYRTVFYKGSTLRELDRFAQGPERMKDIRLLPLGDNGILVFTRPQGAVGGRGKIAFTRLEDISRLNAENIERAKVLEEQFYEEEWGGSNELHLLRNGKIGVLSHIAKFDGRGNRHYYSSCFCFDISTGEYTPMKIIAVRDDFEKGDAKRPDLADVIFSGGIIRRPDGLAQLYCGVGDTQGHVLEIPDPFSEYEI
jgi:hypothetical protein